MTTLHWFPCEQPERPKDAYMRWHLYCHDCHVAALASQRRWPDDQNVALIVGLTSDPDKAWP